MDIYDVVVWTSVALFAGVLWTAPKTWYPVVRVGVSLGVWAVFIVMWAFILGPA